MKARRASDVKKFTDIPNIGPAMAADFALLGIKAPADLKGRDAFALHARLCKLTGTRHDPCVIDTFMAAIDFMEGAPAKPWWRYTKQRKARISKL
ncbi:MAG: mitomycin resistance protein [Candidatus Taylorbacteria bacterium]|nr:mitomycin resistance protein [Candidatus Taylorbacteria bacterium]